MSDYASELARRTFEAWYDSVSVAGNSGNLRESIEGAIREALAKAADIADGHAEDAISNPAAACADAIADSIRALGAKP